MISRIIRGVATGASLSLMLACTGEPVSRQVGPGSTVALALSQLHPDVTVGFGSDLAGPDPLRGQLSFVLCQMATPDCDPSPDLSPRQGYRMTTTYVTRTQADGTAIRAGARIVTAVFEIPSTGSDRPAPGTYWLEPRAQTPSGEILAVLDGAVGTLEVLADDGVPSSLTDDDPVMREALSDRIPRPALKIQQLLPTGARPTAAADLTIDFPDDKVQIVGVLSERSTSLTELIPVDSDTVRVMFVRRGAGDLGDSSIEHTFSLVLEARAGADAVQANEFEIVSQRVYDVDAAPSSNLFEIGDIF